MQPSRMSWVTALAGCLVDRSRKTETSPEGSMNRVMLCPTRQDSGPPRTRRDLPPNPRLQAFDAHVAGEAVLEPRIKNDEVRSLNLTMRHWTPCLSPSPAKPLFSASDRIIPKAGSILHSETGPTPRVPHAVAILVCFLSLDSRSACA
jgi:hypothetical protein